MTANRIASFHSRPFVFIRAEIRNASQTRRIFHSPRVVRALGMRATQADRYRGHSWPHRRGRNAPVTSLPPLASLIPDPSSPPPAMHLSDLVFTGFNKRVAAVHRDSGQLLWQWKAQQSG